MKRGTGLIIVLLAGCASAPAPPTAEYLLEPSFAMEQAATVHTNPQAALARVTLAPYLQRHGIVLETEEQHLETARDHRWAQSLDQSLRRLLQLTITATSGQSVAANPDGAESPQFLIDVDVHRFHGTTDGQVQLVADWQLRHAKDRTIVARRHYAERMTTTAAGYPALVSAHAALAEDLAATIGQFLSGIKEPEQEPRDGLN